MPWKDLCNFQSSMVRHDRLEKKRPQAGKKESDEEEKDDKCGAGAGAIQRSWSGFDSRATATDRATSQTEGTNRPTCSHV
ncbi:hypothetical protein BHE74_00042187 [Ensete ventricosum]|nr:hypothetical protein BHE74_00042187 [Ensete ventricosum]